MGGRRTQVTQEDLVGKDLLTLACESPAHAPHFTKHGNLPQNAIHVCRKVRVMSEQPDDQERPCLHCMIVELIDQFFAEYPAAGGEPDTIETDEVVTAIAKTVAELTCSQNGSMRQQIIEKLMREIMDYDAEFRRDGGTGAVGSDARH